MPKADEMFDEAAMFGGSTENKENEPSSSKKTSKKTKPKHYDDPEEKIIKQFQLKERRVKSQKEWAELMTKMESKSVKSFNKVLVDERRELLTDFKVVENHGKAEFKFIEKIENLLVEKDQVITRMEMEKGKQETLNVKIKEMEKLIHKARIDKAAKNKQKIPTHETEMTEQKAQKRMHVLEGRLHRERSKFNDILADNTKLRELIHTLRLEKKKFVHKQKDLQRECRKNRENSRELMDAATLFYNQQKNDRQKLMDSVQVFNLFQEQATEEQKLLKLKVDKEHVLEDFMDNKLFDRGTMLQEKKDREKKEIQKRDMTRMVKLMSLETAWKKIIRLTTYSHNREHTMTLSNRAVAEFIVSKFNDHENSNYESYNLCNYMVEKNKKLKEGLAEIRERFTDLKTDCSQFSFTQKEDLRMYGIAAEDVEGDKEYVQGSYEEGRRALEEINVKTKALFKKLGIDLKRLELPLKTSDQDIELDEFNRYLALLEDQINRCLVVIAKDSSNEETYDLDSAELLETVVTDFLLPAIKTHGLKYPFVYQIHHPNANPEDLRCKKRKSNNFLQQLLSNESIDEEDFKFTDVPNDEILGFDELNVRAKKIIERKTELARAKHNYVDN